MSQLFSRRASNGGLKKSPESEEPIVRVPLHDTCQSTFSCRVTLEKKVNLGPGQGMQIGVAVQDPRIEPGGHYALDVAP